MRYKINDISNAIWCMSFGDLCIFFFCFRLPNIFCLAVLYSYEFILATSRVLCHLVGKLWLLLQLHNAVLAFCEQYNYLLNYTCTVAQLSCTFCWLSYPFIIFLIILEACRLRLYSDFVLVLCFCLKTLRQKLALAEYQTLSITKHWRWP